MENGGNLVGVEVAILNPQAKLPLVHVVGIVQIAQIEKFLAVFQVVHHQNVPLTPAVESGDNVCTDKSGATRDYEHGLNDSNRL